MVVVIRRWNTCNNHAHFLQCVTLTSSLPYILELAYTNWPPLLARYNYSSWTDCPLYAAMASVVHKLLHQDHTIYAANSMATKVLQYICWCQVTISNSWGFLLLVTVYVMSTVTVLVMLTVSVFVMSINVYVISTVTVFVMSAVHVDVCQLSLWFLSLMSICK